MKKGLFMLLSGLLAFSAAKAQEPPKGPEAPVAGQQLVRLSKITVDPARLAGYNAFLQEEIEASLRLEPGVLALYAVAAKAADNVPPPADCFRAQQNGSCVFSTGRRLPVPE